MVKFPSKMMPDAKYDENTGLWSFTGPFGPATLKFKPNKELGILDHQYKDNDSLWDVPMRVVDSGDTSEVIITLFQPSELSDSAFDERIKVIEEMMQQMKNIIENE